jgi:hypothetical protein
MFEIFRKKEPAKGLDGALQDGTITKSEYLKIIADRAAEELRKFLEDKKVPVRRRIDK